jgi:hypothetical protein
MLIDPGQSETLAIKVRIPGWARGQAVPGNLYRFTEQTHEPVTLSVNGKSVPILLERGYVTLRREWQSGDTIELNLPMPVRRIVANTQVAQDRGRVALQRGPLVYAAEWLDNPNHKVRNLLLPDRGNLTASFEPSLLNGVEVVKSTALALAYDAAGHVTKTEQPFTAVPYYSWANRGKGQMLVWIPDSPSGARPAPFPTLAMNSAVAASHGGNHINGEGIQKSPAAVNDGDEPSASNDPSSYFDWWPEKGKTEWIEYTFPRTTSVSHVEVYWFDDAGRGEVRVPASWRILFQDGAEWKPVQDPGTFSVDRDRYNSVDFHPVATTGLRLEVTMQQPWSAGVQKWKVR